MTQVLVGLLRTMRPKQWTKSLLFIFPAIVFDGKLFDAESFARVMLASILFSLVSGTVYIINDLVDIENDRQHPTKRNRPLPSGQLPVGFARVAAIILPIIALAISLFSPELTFILLAYLILQTLYSFSLKHIVIIDVLVIMIGFMLRIRAGVVVIDVENFSPWLYACAGLLALFLAVGKRRQELVTLGNLAAKTRPIFEHYNLQMIDEMMRVVTSGTLITYLLYTIEVDTPAGDNLGLVTVIFVIYGLFRYLYLIHVKGEGSAPDEILLKDRPIQITILLFGLSFFIIIYLLPETTI